MKFNLNEVTRKIEKQISISLSFCILCGESRTALASTKTVALAELYTHVRWQVGQEVTAGLFNKVVDDMTRIGLLRVDRKTKQVVDVQYERLVSPSELKTIGDSSIHPIHQNYHSYRSGWQWLAQLCPSVTPEQAKAIVEKAVADEVQS